MKNTSLRRAAILSAVVGATLAGTSAKADLWWNPGGAGDGTWDTISLNWNDDPNAAGTQQVWAGAGTAIFSAGAGYSGAFTVTMSGAQTGAALNVEEGSILFNTGGTLALTGGTISVANGATATFASNVLNGTSGITKEGTGVLDIGAAQAITKGSAGTLTINAGTVAFSNDAAFGAAPGAAAPADITLNGGALRYTGTGATMSANRGITIGVNGGTIDVPKLNSISGLGLSGTGGGLTGASTAILNKTGAGRFTLNLTQTTYLGKYRILGGLINVAGEGRLGATPGSVSSDYLFMDGGGLRYATVASAQTLGVNRGITLGAGGGKIIMPGSGSVTVSSIIAGTLNGSMTFDWQDAASTTSEGGAAGGIIILNALNTYNGNTTVNAGTTLRVGTNVGVIPDTSNVTLASGLFDLNGFNETVASVIVNGTGARILTGSGTPILTATSYDLRSSTTAAGQGISVNIGGAASATKTTANSVLLSAVNSYTGNTTISAGTLNIDADSTLGNGAGTLNLSGGTLNTTASRTVTTDAVPNPINLTANSVISTTSAATTVNLNFSSNTVGGSGGQLTFINIGADAGTDIFQPRFGGNGFVMSRPIVIDNGAIGKTNLSSFNATGTTQTFSGGISGSGSYTRNASSAGNGGKTVFTVANTYAGGTTISEGILLANNASGSATGTGPIAIGANGTLGGTGGVTGAITSSGNVSPGDGGVGTLKTGDVTLSTGTASLAADIDISGSPAADLLDVTGTVTLTGSTLSLTLLNAPAPETYVSQTYVLVNNDAADAVTGTFDTTILSVPGYLATIDYAYTGTDALGRIGDGNDIAVTVAVPEPTSCMLLLLGGMAGLLGRRRRNAKAVLAN